MKSPISYFDAAVFKNNIRRFGFIGILFAIIHFIIVPLNLILGNISRWAFQDGGFSRIVPHFWDVMVLFSLPVLLGIVLYRYIQEERALSVHHALPVTRKAYYGTSLATFLAIYYGPVLLGIGISLAVIGSTGYFSLAVLSVFGKYALMMLVAGVAVFSITAAFGMLVGSSVLQGILVYVMMIVPYGLYQLFNLLLSWMVRGYPYRSMEETVFYLSPYVASLKFFDDGLAGFWTGLLVFAVYAAVFTWLAYHLYKKRDLEKHHELLAFNRIREGFVYILTTIVMLLIAVYVGELSGDKTAGIFLGVFIGSVIGFSITKMVAYKTINIFKYYKGWLLYLGLAMAVFLVIHMGLFGYEKRLPDPDAVSAVLVSEYGSPISSQDLEELESEAYLDRGYNRLFKLESPEAIARVAALHRYYAFAEESLLESGDPYGLMIQGEPVIHTQLNLLYLLEGGGEMARSYNGPVPFSLVKGLYETREVREERAAMAARVLLSEDVYQIRLSSYADDAAVLEAGEAGSLYEAYARDLMAVPYDAMVMGNTLGTIEVVINRREPDSSYKDYRNFEILPGSRHVVAWARERYPDFLLEPSAEQVERMVVIDTEKQRLEEGIDSRMPSTEKPFATEYETMEFVEKAEGQVYEDKGLIQQVLEQETVYGPNRWRVVFYLDESRSFTRSYATLPESML